MKNKITILTIAIILGLATYVYNQSKPNYLEKDKISEIKLPQSKDKLDDESKTQRNFKSYSGYIDNNRIECVIDFSCQDDSLFGYFSYSYGNNDTFKLIGICENVNTRHGGPWLHLDVIDNRQVKIARWDYVYKDDEGVYRGDYLEAVRKTTKSIYISAVDTSLYLDSITQECFRSYESYDLFLSNNHFASGSNYLDEGGLILPMNMDSSSNKVELLPKGLDLFQFNNCAGLCPIELIEVGTVLDRQILSFSQWSWEGKKEITARDFSLNFSQIGYEKYALRYSYLYDENFVCIKSNNGSSLFLSISQLKSMGYYLENDSYFHIHNSPQIPFYPTANIDIRDKPDIKANVRHTATETNRQYFEVIQSKEGWLEIKYHTHDYEPCTEISIEKKPVIRGWIPLYRLTDGDSEQNLTLYFNPRGC